MFGSTNSQDFPEQDAAALERLFSAPDSLYCVLGFDGRFIKMGGNWSGFLGLSETELYDHTLLDLVHPDDLLDTIRAFSKLSSSSRETIHYEGRLRTTGNISHWFSWHIVSDPATSQINALGIDITEKKRLQELFEVTLESAPIGMLLTDHHGSIKLCNRQIEKQFGYLRHELMDKPVEMLVPEGYRENHLKLRERCLADPKSRQLDAERELQGLRKDGAEFPMEIELNPVETPDGYYILSMIIDISEQHESRQLLERHTRLMELTERTALVGGWEYDLLTDELYWTNETYKIHGLDPETYTPTIESAKQFIDPVYRDEVEQNFSRLRRGESIDSELKLTDAQGKCRYVRVIAHVMLEQGVLRKFYGSIQDITEIKQATAELLLRDRCLANASDGILITDPNLPDNPIIYCNKGFVDLTGYGPDEVLGRNCRFLQGAETDEDAVRQVRDAIESGNSCNVVLRNYRKDGSIFWNRLSITPVVEQGKITHFIGVQTDITETMKLSDELSYQASHDSLTDLINRREFETRLEQALYRAKVDRTNHVMCYLDLDNFKVVNDTAGHIAGDELLRQIPEIFHQHIRGGDRVARLGGDEFGLLLENCSIERATGIVRGLLEGIQNYRFVWEERAFRIGASIGLVAITPESGSVIELLKQADAACYMAKESGGNRVHCYEIGDMDIERHQTEMESVSLITQALENDRFYLDYQTIKALNGDDGGGEHYELLLRLQDEDGKQLQPRQFLPAAERFQLSPRLDRWVIETAFQTLKRRPEYLDQLFLCSINLSGISFNNVEFQQFVEQKLTEYSIPGNKICFEITETAAIRNMSRALQFIERLKKHGCRFSLDDFGSGLSSFAYLGTLPVDFIKIDGQFVHDIHQNKVHRAMVNSIHEITTLMGKQTIAEFVESPSIIAELETIGVNYMQGFGISRPQSLDDKYPL